MSTILAERYELKERLGRGGMASVYLGTDRVLDRTVAVKVLDASLGRDPEFVERFRREARAAAGLSHPGTVAIFDTGEDAGRRFIVMELVEGETLADLLAREAPLEPRRAALLAAQVLEALAAAHDRGLVHRDVKPGNILLTPRGEPKVTDFGIARADASQTLTVGPKVLGTAAYLAPEQARGDRVDARCDLYAMGCVLFEMLSGAPPFRGSSPIAVASKHLHEDPPPLPDAPPALRAAVLTALEKDPADRFPDARSMARALREAADGTAPRGGAPPAAGGDTDVLDPAGTEPIPPPEAPHRGGLLLVGAAALLALAAVLALVLGDRPAAERSRRDGGGAAAPSPESSPQEAEEAEEAEEAALTPEGAYIALVGAVEEGLEAGDLAPRPARDIVRRAEEAMERWARDDLEGALRKLDEAAGALLDGARRGEVSPEREREIEDRIAALRAALEAHPPREEEDEGDGGGPSDGGTRGPQGGGPDGTGPPGHRMGGSHGGRGTG